MILRLKKYYITFAAILGAFAPFPSFANCSDPQGKAIDAVSGGSACNNADLPGKVGGIIDTLFLVAGSIAVIIMIVGGIRYITSTGNATRIQQAKDTILYAIVGLIVVIVARAIVGFVIQNVS